MFWKFPEVEKQICEFIESISTSGGVRRKILMTGDTKDAKNISAAKSKNLKKTSSLN